VTVTEPALDHAGLAARVRLVEPAARAVEVRSVSKRFGTGDASVLALDHITFGVDRGEFVCLVGASGCGKSTLLSLVAGLDAPSGGDIAVTGRTALMFQDAALLPWRTAVANVELPMKLRGVRPPERRARALELLDLVRLAEFADRRPHELSGGMRQRVALARALAQDADVLLMDEPFGALDAITRDVLHDELERVVSEQGLSVVFVTHNVREAARLGQRVVLLSSRPGRVAGEWRIAETTGRRIESPEVAALSIEITEQLRKEIRRNAA
jgi:NitT/TauT family transport system ATP-binding protein